MKMIVVFSRHQQTSCYCGAQRKTEAVPLKSGRSRSCWTCGAESAQNAEGALWRVWSGRAAVWALYGPQQSGCPPQMDTAASHEAANVQIPCHTESTKVSVVHNYSILFLQPIWRGSVCTSRLISCIGPHRCGGGMATTALRTVILCLSIGSCCAVSCSCCSCCCSVWMQPATSSPWCMLRCWLIINLFQGGEEILRLDRGPCCCCFLEFF